MGVWGGGATWGEGGGESGGWSKWLGWGAVGGDGWGGWGTEAGGCKMRRGDKGGNGGASETRARGEEGKGGVG